MSHCILFFFKLFLGDYSPQWGGNQRKQNGFCPSNSLCVPLESCPVLNNIMSHDCVLSSRYYSKKKSLIKKLKQNKKLLE